MQPWVGIASKLRHVLQTDKHISKYTQMKSFIIILLSVFSTGFSAQVLINKGTKSDVSSTSVSLEFGNEIGGIILPYVTESAATGASVGTLIMDPGSKSVKYFNGTVWKDITGQAAKTNTVANITGGTESAAAKVIIGSNQEDPAPGVLVLSDTNKAMVLPHVAKPHLNIINPAAGMIVYDSSNRMLAVFNGTQWSFWKP